MAVAAGFDGRDERVACDGGSNVRDRRHAGGRQCREDVGPTLVVVGIVRVLLQLIARPVTRWVTSDAAGMGGIGRAMAASRQVTAGQATALRVVPR